MQILVIGDVHGNIGLVKDLIKKENPDFVLQVGDLSEYSEFEKPLYFIGGNHENQDILEKMDNKKLIFKNLHHIKNGDIINLSKGNNSITILGLGGNYSPSKFNLPRSKLQGDRRRHFVEDDIKKCLMYKRVDIFLTHESPYCLNLTKQNSKENIGIKIIDKVINKIKPLVVFSGHHHYFKEKTIGKIKLISLDRPNKGYYIIEKDSSQFKLIKNLENEP